MTRYLAQRLISAVPVALLMTLVVFAVFQLLPGNVVDYLLGEEGADPAVEAHLREELGLNDPAPIRYLKWLSGVLRGDLGTSPILREPVGSLILERLQPTLELSIASWLIAVVLAIPAGILSAIRRGTWLDTAATLAAVGGVAMPSFWMGILLVLLFSIYIPLLPPSGYVPFTEDPLDSLAHLALPAVTLGLHLSAGLMRQVRSSMLEVLSQDYVTTARAKGLSEHTVIIRHALRNAMLPVLTIGGVQIALLLGGVVVIEQVFAIPGMGRLAVDAIFARDHLTVQGVVLFMAAVVLLVNLATDLLYVYIDRRIQY